MDEQMAFFDMPPPAVPAMKRAAVIIGEHRLELRRVWDQSKPLLVVCMLNPSDADHQKEDPTLWVVIHFAKLWGYGGALVVNLFSLITSSPGEMMALSPQLSIGDSNDGFIADAIGYARDNGKMLLAAWGNHGAHCKRDEWMVRECHRQGVDLVCLGTTLGGHPKHPLARGHHRVPRDQQPIVWKSAA